MYIDTWNKQWGFISAGNLERKRKNISWSLSHSINPSNWLSEEVLVFFRERLTNVPKEELKEPKENVYLERCEAVITVPGFHRLMSLCYS